ncbi:hypothetical protein ZWY2020_026776 [Hordeum vulgare]|nr:hypothetical protein ZWY2020_026776 [Hordeum vulgare]
MHRRGHRGTTRTSCSTHKGAFYTVRVDSELNEWVPDGSSAGLRARIVASPRTEPVRGAPVLVESTTRDELLMVNRGDMEILVKDNVGLCVPRRGEPIMSTSSWFYSVDYDSSDSTSYGPYDCSLWRYGSWFLPYVAPEFYHY